jgi:PAS domain S-box-containing protein
VVLLSILPVANILMFWTDDWHHLIWQQTEIVKTTSGLSMLQNVNGPWFAVHALYSYLLLFGGILLMFWTAYRKTGSYRRQALIIACGALVPSIPNLLVVFGGNPLAPLDLTPFAFTMSGVFMASAFLRYRLMELIPVARSAVVESMSDALLVLDLQNRIIDLNPAMSSLLSCSLAELIGQPAREALAHWPDLLQEYGDVMDTHVEITIKQDQLRYFDLRISPLLGHGDEVSGRLVVLRDITERKMAEDELLAQKQLFENLVAVARATTERPTLEATLRNVLNVSMGLTEAERGSIFLLGKDNEVTHSILTRTDSTSQEHYYLVENAMKRGLAGWVLKNNQPALIDDVLQDDRWLMLTDAGYLARSVLASPISGNVGTVGILTLEHAREAHFNQSHLALIQSACDQMALTLRNAQMFEAQRQLANREAISNRVLRAVGEHLDPQIALQVAVDTIAEITQWPAVSILLPDQNNHLVTLAVGGSIGIRIGWHVPIHSGVTGRAFCTGRTQNVLDVFQDPDYIVGDKNIRSEVSVPLRRGKRIIGVLDIESDQFAAFNEDAVQLIEALAEAIALSLENAQLYDEMAHAKELAEYANTTKSDFISIVAHELKVPMTSIRGYASLLSKGAAGQVTPQQDDFLSIIRSNVDRMSTLVSDLTDISRIESGKARLDLKTTDLAPIIAEVTRSAQLALDEKDHDLVIDMPGELPQIMADSARMVQILTNLLSNANKYTPQGGNIALKVTLPAQDSDATPVSKMLSIFVADTGLGIKPAEHDKIFTRFFRSEDDAVRNEHGTGLGLNITKLLVEQQGGEIWFESEYGKGSTFAFTVPVTMS